MSAWRRTSAALTLAFVCSAVSAQVVGSHGAPFAPRPFDHARFVHVGHDNIVVDPTIRRYTGMVAALAAPDAQGKSYSFEPSPVGPRSFPLSLNDLRGWRMTVLSGKRFGQVFSVATNTESQITVTPDKGSLDGLAVHDVFIVESVDANGVSMFGSAPGSAAPDSPGT